MLNIFIYIELLFFVSIYDFIWTSVAQFPDNHKVSFTYLRFPSHGCPEFCNMDVISLLYPAELPNDYMFKPVLYNSEVVPTVQYDL